MNGGFHMMSKVRREIVETKAKQKGGEKEMTGSSRHPTIHV